MYLGYWYYTCDREIVPAPLIIAQETSLEAKSNNILVYYNYDKLLLEGFLLHKSKFFKTHSMNLIREFDYMIDMDNFIGLAN